jgi:hypothetical protein
MEIEGGSTLYEVYMMIMLLKITSNSFMVQVYLILLINNQVCSTYQVGNRFSSSLSVPVVTYSEYTLIKYINIYTSVHTGIQKYTIFLNCYYLLKLKCLR